jgi:hypothetical protein
MEFMNKLSIQFFTCGSPASSHFKIFPLGLIIKILAHPGAKNDRGWCDL